MGKPKTWITEKKWYCHVCEDGPLNLKLVPSCLICYHPRCEHCRIVKLKYPIHELTFGVVDHDAGSCVKSEIVHEPQSSAADPTMPSTSPENASPSHPLIEEPGLSCLQDGGVPSVTPEPMELPDDLPSCNDRQKSPASTTKTEGLTDRSFDSDLLSLSYSSDDDTSPVEKISPTITTLRAAVVLRLVSGYQAALNDATSKTGAIPSTTPNKTPTLPSSETSQPSSKKRKSHTDATNDANPEDSSSSSEPQRPKRPKHPPSKPNHNPPPKGATKILACPFWKASPQHHSTCLPKLLRRIRDVKQHLSRKHRPQYYCERCKTIFPSEPLRRAHVEHDGPGLLCTPSPNLEGMTHQQQWHISRKSNPKLTEPEQWFAIWDILFPGTPRPASGAYRDAAISADLSLFREYCRARGPEILDEEMQAMIDAGRWSPGGGPPELLLRAGGEQRRRILRWVLDEGLEMVFGELRSRVPGSEDVDDAAAQRQHGGGLVLPAALGAAAPAGSETLEGSEVAGAGQLPADGVQADLVTDVAGASVGDERTSDGRQWMQESLMEVWPDSIVQDDYQPAFDFENFMWDVELIEAGSES